MTAKRKTRIESIITKLAEGLYEREETISVSLLAALSGQSTFLYGLPGTAKSLIARRIAQAFQGAKHFEYLMQRFSTPEEVFGPVSIHELKNDKYVRKTDGYLPCADIAFLDEIWKSSPAILNTLLTIINERVFRNGAVEAKVPLKALIAASNETPPANQGLEALYDRFVVRLIVSPMQERENFERLLQDVPIESTVSVPENLRLTHDEWKSHLDAISRITLPAEVLDVIHAIKILIKDFNNKNPDKSVYVSDRRWQKISQLLKAAAYFCDRDQVLVVDLMLLRHCLWTQESNREPIVKLVEDGIKQVGHPDRAELEKWEANHRELEDQINQTLFHSEDTIYTEKIGEEECMPFVFKLKTGHYGERQDKYYASISHRKTATEFQPIDEDGVFVDNLLCSFSGSVLNVKIDSVAKKNGMDCGYPSGNFVAHSQHPPQVQIAKGTAKQVPARVKNLYMTASDDSVKAMSKLIRSTENFHRSQQQQDDTPFVPPRQREIVLAALQDHINELQNNLLTAERLLEKVCKHASVLTPDAAPTSGKQKAVSNFSDINLAP